MTVRTITLAAALLLATVAAGPLEAQSSSGAVIMRSAGHITWWVVDSDSGTAAFFGGDIAAICSGDPSGYDLLDFREVTDPREVARTMQARGEVGVSVWDSPPPFVMPRLCNDILSRDGPSAVGTAGVSISGRFPVTWADPDVTSPFGLSASGMVETTAGESLRLQAGYRCVTVDATMSCRQHLQIR